MICKNQVIGHDKNGKLFLHPCGQCLACRINDTRAWYVRSHFELKKLERPFQYFITLTYNDESLPDDNFCSKKDLKNFLNNFNTSYSLRMRYFATADYGSLNGRPHYHAIILSTKKITQAQVERIWKRGFVLVKPLSKERVKYTLRYTVKKMPFDKSDKKLFRLISKGWGNNVKDYYTGQDYFEIDGKKYGITDYMRQKIGLDKEPVVHYSNMDNLVHGVEKYYKKRSLTVDEYYNQLNHELQKYQQKEKL